MTAALSNINTQLTNNTNSLTTLNSYFDANAKLKYANMNLITYQQ